jgi:hypothetical protein
LAGWRCDLLHIQHRQGQAARNHCRIAPGSPASGRCRRPAACHSGGRRWLAARLSLESARSVSSPTAPRRPHKAAGALSARDIRCMKPKGKVPEWRSSERGHCDDWNWKYACRGHLPFGIG